MIIAYSAKNQFKPNNVSNQNRQQISESLWIDLLNPSKEEETLIEGLLNVDIPTREEMQEIEVSSRLYKENGAIFMTVTMVARSDSLEPKSDAVTLILIENKLITVRYIEPQSFASITTRISKLLSFSSTAIDLLIEILDASVERLADILEKVSHGLDTYSQAIFRPEVETEGKVDILLAINDEDSYRVQIKMV